MDRASLPPPLITSFVLVPGFWLGAWAWDEVAGRLRAAGHRVQAVTLPGLERLEMPRRGIGLADHIAAVVAVVLELGPGVVLVGHSGAGAVIYGVTDAVPDHVDRAVYVDSGPIPDGAALSPDLDPRLDGIRLPSWAELEAGGSSLEGLDERMKAAFRARAVPHPAGPARDRLHLTNPRRTKVPVTMITTTYRAGEVARLAREGHPFFAELNHLQVEYVDLPTGHWPMWSRPEELTSALIRAGHGAP